MTVQTFIRIGALLDGMQSVTLPRNANRDDAEAYALAMELLRQAEAAYCNLDELTLLGLILEARAVLDEQELQFNFSAWSTAIEVLQGIEEVQTAITIHTEPDSRARSNS